jgi:hypothetical protein
VQYRDTSGPDCRGLADIDAEIAQAQRGEFYCPYPPDDGVDSPESSVRREPYCYNGGPDDGGDPPAAAARAGNSLPFELAGSTAELDFVRSILGYQTGVAPGEVSDLSASTLAPLLRGTRVVLR